MNRLSPPEGPESLRAVFLAQAQDYLRACRAQGRPSDALRAAWVDFFQIVDACLRHLVAAAKLRADQRNDVVQEAWEEIVQKLQGDDFDSAAGFHRWMRRVVRSKAVDIIRDLVKRRGKSLDALPAEPMDQRPNRQDEAEDREWLMATLKELEEKEPMNCWLLREHHLAGRTIKELAVETGLTVHAIHNRLDRLREKLRARAERP